MSCLGCPNRFPYRHSICDDYAEEKKMRENINKFNRESNGYVTSYDKTRHINKAIRSKQKFY